jgi:hypothetical protein
MEGRLAGWSQAEVDTAVWGRISSTSGELHFNSFGLSTNWMGPTHILRIISFT